MADKKNVNEEAMNQNEEQQVTPEVPDKKDEKPAKEPGKIRKFFADNKGKIGVGLGVAGAFAAGIVADKLGIKIGSKKDGDQPGDTAE